MLYRVRTELPGLAYTAMAQALFSMEKPTLELKCIFGFLLIWGVLIEQNWLWAKWEVSILRPMSPLAGSQIA